MEIHEQHPDHFYDELRRMAGAFMRRERPGHTLQPTALANEAFLSVGSSAANWQNTAHYFGAAAVAMRQVLIQHARKRKASKRGGGAQRVTLDELTGPREEASIEAQEIREALAALATHDSTLGSLVESRYFDGLTLEEIAAQTGRSVATLKRDWKYARAWLLEYLTRSR